MRKTLAEIAKIVDGEVIGDKSLVITGVSGIREAKEGDLTFVANSKYIPLIGKTRASAIMISKDIDAQGKSAIRTDNPSLAFANFISAISDGDEFCIKGIHETAQIGQGVKIGKNVAIGAYTVIEDKVSIGDGAVIYSGCFLGHHTKIGKKCFIYSNVTIRERIEIGDRVIIHSGTVLGSDGFGFELVDGIHEKIPQIGTVVIGDDVEIGANVTIDRARFDKTVIGRGTKIDNLVQIAHNVVIGEKCIIVAQVGISGSVTIKDGVILAGQAGVVGHITIGEGAVVAAKSGVTKSIAPHQTVSGFPARSHKEEKKVYAALQRLPIYAKVIEELQRKIEKLEKKLK